MSPALRFPMMISIFCLIAILWHFGTVFELWGHAPETRADFFIRIGIIIATSIVGSIIGGIIMGIASDKEEAFEPDEREIQIERKAELIGYYSLAAAICILMWHVFDPMTPMQVANALLGAFAHSELIKLLATFVLLRRGV